MSDLHALFNKLDDATSDRAGWLLKRVQGRIGLAWRVEVRLADSKDISAENAAPELAIRTVLGLVLEHAQSKGRGKEDEARKHRDEVERLRTIVGGAGGMGG